MLNELIDNTEILTIQTPTTNSPVMYTTDELFVNLSKTKSFTQKDLTILNNVRCKAAHPHIYGNNPSFGLKHLDTIILDMNDIDPNMVHYFQDVRDGINKDMRNIETDIRVNGYSLAALPIRVMKKDGKWVIVEGRTRYDILRNMGVKNIIVDTFEEVSDANALRAGGAANNEHRPAGKLSVKDVRKIIIKLVNIGEIDKNAPNFNDLVRAEILSLMPTMAKPNIDEICIDAMNAAAGETIYLSFPRGAQGHGPAKWLKEHKYYDNADIRYVPVATFADKVVTTAVSKLLDSKTGHRQEIRLVIHGGVLNVNDPAGDWETRVKGFKTYFMRYLDDISKTFYGGVPIDMKRIKLHGAIPMVKSLEEKYPMDELYLFD